MKNIIEQIKKAIDITELKQFQKNIANRFVDEAHQQAMERNECLRLIKAISTNEDVDIVISTDEVKIYKIRQTDDWSKKYPYRSIYFDSKSGQWQNMN